MTKPQNEEKKYKLSNLTVNSIGLVRRGANKSPFFFVKSADGAQGEGMSDEKEKEVQVEALTTDEVEAFRAWMAAQAEEPAADGSDADEATPTTVVNNSAALDTTVDFSEELARREKELTDSFSAKLEAATTKTEKLTERLDASEHLRRLREFTDVAATYSLPISGTEQFGADLMAIKDNVTDEVYTRLTTMLRASDEAVRQGELFSQFSHAGPVETGDPFLGKVEIFAAKLVEADPLMDGDDAFKTAMEKTAERHPKLAKAYALKGGA